MERGFGEGKGLEEMNLTPEIMSWMDQAINTYWHDRIYNILNRVGSGDSDEVIFQLWNEALDDLHGDNHNRKKDIYDMALADKKVSKEAKEWLKTLQNLVKKNSHLF